VVEPVETQGEVSTAPTGGRACRDRGWGLDRLDHRRSARDGATQL